MKKVETVDTNTFTPATRSVFVASKDTSKEQSRKEIKSNIKTIQLNRVRGST